MSTRPKVVLYNPRCVFWTMPLALLAVGSALDRARFDVVVIDGRLEPDPMGALLRELDERTICLGITALTGSPLRDALLATRTAHAAHPSLPIVWGGWHPSLFPAECLDEPGVTAAVSAQGEDTFRELVERFASDPGASLDGVAGCAHRDAHGRPVVEPARALRGLDAFPAHDYELVPVERYFGAKKRRQLDYISSQGCRFRCTFCADPFVYQRGWTGLSADRVGADLARAFERYRFDDVNFQDETYFTHRERVNGISEELLRRGVRATWAATMRADQGVRLSEHEWALCKRSGLRRVLVGVESGSQAMLDWLHKDIKLEQVFETAEKMVRHRVAGVFPFIVGFPEETDESVEATLATIKRLRAMSPDFEVSVYFYQPYPGSPIAELAWKRGHAKPSSLEQWADFDFVGSRGPWVTNDKWERVQRFEFYQRHAFNRVRHPAQWPLRWLSRARLKRDFYRAPVEKLLFEALRPAEALS